MFTPPSPSPATAAVTSLDRALSRPRLLSVACAVAVLAGGANAQSIVNLGALQPGHTFSQGNSVSHDGTVVAGMSAVEFWDETRTFRWSGGSRADIGSFDSSMNVIGGSVSANGQWIAGTSYGTAQVPFRWSQATGMQPIPMPDDAEFGGEVNSISGDGSAVTGTIDGERAFRWTAGGGVEMLGVLPGGSYAWGLSISANATVITGISATGAGERAFVWTESAGMQALPLIGAEEWAGGLAANADGSAIAGYDGMFAARWVNGVGQSLGAAPGGTFSYAYAISGNGLVVGGLGDNAAGDTVALVWTESLGMVDLNAYLPTLGVDLTGWELTVTTGISFDGTTMVGAGVYNGVERGWLVTIPTPGAAAVLGLGGLLAARRRRA